MGMKMEHHQKDKDGNTIPHEGEEINEVIGQLAGGALGTAMGKGIAGKAIGGAIGAGAGEILDPFKKGKDKNPVAAALGGASTGAIQGGVIGKAGEALSKKFPETTSKITKNIVNPIKDKVSDIVGGKGKGATSETTKTISSVADNIKKNEADKKKFKNNPNKYFGTEVNSYEPEGDELVETPKIDQKLRKDAKPIKPGPLYKTGRTKEQMGDKAVASRRNIRNADDRNAADKSRFGSMSPAKETAERREKHIAARGVKTKGMSEGMATPESGTGKYYNEKKPTEMQLAKRKKMEKVKSLTNQGKHKEASALYKETFISRFNSKVREEYNKGK